MNQDQRDPFEAWCKERFGQIPLWVEEDSQYLLSSVQLRFEAYQAALASPEVQALRNDSERLEFLIAEECQVKTLTLRKGKGYRLYWPDLEETQAEWFTNPRAAIDAAM